MPLSIEVDPPADVGTLFANEDAFFALELLLVPPLLLPFSSPCSSPHSSSSNKSSIATSSNPITSPSSALNALLANPILAAQDAAPDLTSGSGWISNSSNVPS